MSFKRSPIIPLVEAPTENIKDQLNKATGLKVHFYNPLPGNRTVMNTTWRPSGDHPTLYLSKYIIQHKDEYYYLLQSVTSRQAWKEWVLFMLEAVEKTSRLTSSLINEILAQMEVTLHHGRENIKWVQ